jgi:hypothetical protein
MEVQVSDVGKAMWWERSRIICGTRLVPISLVSLPCRGRRCEVKSAVVIILIGGLDLSFRLPSPLTTGMVELARLIPFCPPRHLSDPAIRAFAAPSKRSRRVRLSIRLRRGHRIGRAE